MKRMLINATHKDQELRIAIADGQRLDNLIIDSSSHEQKQGNIYLAVVTRIEVSLEAAFVNFGGNRHGFLPLKEVAHSCFKKDYADLTRRPSIDEVLEEGQQLIIQVEKEERGSKGAAVTTYISLPGSYLVLMPNSPGAGGVSRRIDGDERSEIHEAMSQLVVPEGMGLIIRTAGAGRSIEELQWDLGILLKVWSAILEDAQHKEAPSLIYQEGDAVIRAMRDHLLPNIDEILVDQEQMFEHIIKHLKLVRPDFVNRVKLYKEPTPLFNRFQIESQIERIYQRQVELPSGGALIIDRTEALVSIDINSARSTKGSDIEETAFLTNLEAAEEIPRQLRLRDLGGLIVIDFIDMLSVDNQREVEKRLKKHLKTDRARVQTGRISRFGLLEMSRQRLRTSIGESSQITCPRCDGHGSIRGVESLSLSVMRIIEEEALKDNTAQVRALVPIEIAAYLLNEKRKAIIDIEHRQHVSVMIVPTSQLLTPQYHVERIRLSDWNEREERKQSYTVQLKQEKESAPHPKSQPAQSAKPSPAPQGNIVKTSQIHETVSPAPQIKPGTPKSDSGLFSNLRKVIRSLLSSKEPAEMPRKTAAASNGTSHGDRKRPPYRRREGGQYRDGRDGSRHHQGGQRRHHKKRSAHRYHEDQRRERSSNDQHQPASENQREQLPHTAAMPETAPMIKPEVRTPSAQEFVNSVPAEPAQQQEEQPRQKIKKPFNTRPPFKRHNKNNKRSSSAPLGEDNYLRDDDE